MTDLRRQASAWIGVALVALVVGQALAQPGPPWGRGRGGRGQGGDPQFVADRDVFHFLLANHDQVRRQVTPRADGVETLTESDQPEIAAKIQEHVAAMHRRVVEVRPIHVRDPLFAEVFRHAGQIEMKVEKTKKGVKVVETSKDPYVAKLIQAHAQVVDGFVKNGFAEAQKNHAVPDSFAAEAKPADEPNTVAAGSCGPCAACPNAVATNVACKTCPNAASCAAGKACPAAAGCGCAACPSAAAGGAKCQACPQAAAANPACKSCPNAAACATGKTCPAATGSACATCPSAASAGVKCQACPQFAVSNPACKACPNAAACAAGKTCPAAAGCGCAACPSAAAGGAKCQACPQAAAANPACKSCPNAAVCAAGKTCPAGAGAGCKTCPLSSQCPSGDARPAAKLDADAPPPPNQGAKKS